MHYDIYSHAPRYNVDPEKSKQCILIIYLKSELPIQQSINTIPLSFTVIPAAITHLALYNILIIKQCSSLSARKSF